MSIALCCPTIGGSVMVRPNPWWKPNAEVSRTGEAEPAANGGSLHGSDHRRLRDDHADGHGIKVWRGVALARGGCCGRRAKVRAGAEVFALGAKDDRATGGVF